MFFAFCNKSSVLKEKYGLNDISVLLYRSTEVFIMTKRNQCKTTTIFALFAIFFVAIGFFHSKSLLSSSLRADSVIKSIFYDAETNCYDSGVYTDMITYDAEVIVNKGNYNVDTRVAALDSYNAYLPFEIGGNHFLSMTSNNMAARIAVAIGVNNPTSFSIDFEGTGGENPRASITLVDISMKTRIDGFEVFSNTTYDLSTYSGVRYMSIVIGHETVQTGEFSVFVNSISASWMC